MSGPSIREALSAAMENTSPAPASGPETTSTPEVPAERAPEHAPEAPADTASPPTQRARAPDGRFARPHEPPQAKPGGEPRQPTPHPGETAEAALAAPKPDEPHAKPPANMKAHLRETWANVPKPFQEEFHRVNVEAKKALEMSAQARKTADAFQQTIQPYTPFIQGEPLQVVGNLLQTAVQLQTAPPAHKAAIVARIIEGYGVDVEALADALEKRPAAPQQQPQGQQFQDPRFDQFLGHLQQVQRQRQERMQAENSRTLQEFASKHEFFEDVRLKMAAFMQAARESGETITLDEAYEAACLADKNVRPLYQQRTQAQSQANARASTQAARAASSSVRHEPTAPTQGNRTPTLRGAIEAAWASSTK